MPIRVEEFAPPQENEGSYIAYGVWLDKINAGKVVAYWQSHMLDYPVVPPSFSYYADLSLPIPMEGGKLDQPYRKTYIATKNKQEALDNLLSQVRQWIADAGLMLATEARDSEDEQPTD